MPERRGAEIGPVHAIVPLKSMKNSKTRLSGLASKDRRKLTMAMFCNVLDALTKSRMVSDVTVVSGERSVSGVAQRHGARFLSEGSRHDLNSALKLAIGKLDGNDGGTAMIIHADLPRLTTKDVNELVSRSKHIQIAIAPCKNGTGTNALLLRPPNAIPPAFGKGSFRRHLSLAKKTGYLWKVLRISGIQFDIDDPQDLREFTSHDPLGKTFRYLGN
jgi:2-phospho-L-lactate guanylyltransferase